MKQGPQRCRWLAPLLVALLAAACSPVYVLRAGMEQARILSRRQPIAEVITDPATSPETRRKLELVLQARTFAERGLGLAAGESYTTFSTVDSDTLLLVVSAARPDRFEAYTWWFPIVGRVPYKGYFDFEAAHGEAAGLADAGYDVYVRPAAAFSTLGWFNDPLLNTLLRFPDVDLVGTVIHELLHNTIFLPGQVAFNESFANFVGDNGAIVFFCARDGEAAEPCNRARETWADTRRYGRFLTELVTELETLYARTELPLDALLAERELVFDRYRTRYRDEVMPLMHSRRYHGFLTRPLNNATLIGTRLYYQRLDLFEEILQRWHGDLATVIAVIDAAARSRPADPFAAVAALVDGESAAR
jgi:predicted aminopeptidase